MTIEEIKKRVKLWTGMKTTMKTWIYKQIYDFCVERKRPPGNSCCCDSMSAYIGYEPSFGGR